MATLKEFEEALKGYNMVSALAVLDEIRKRDKAKRSAAAPRRVAAQKMTPDLARAVLDLHKATSMTQQEIAFKLGVNQGRVNEVIKHGKWLSGNPNAPEAKARDKALARIAKPSPPLQSTRNNARSEAARILDARPRRQGQAQLSLGDL